MSKKSKKEKTSNFTENKDLFLIFTLVLTFFVYAGGLRFDILNFDDNEYFSNYPEIVKLTFSNIVSYFSGYYVLMFQPLPVFSFALGYAIADLNPVVHHLINLLFHLYNIYLVYVLIGLLNFKIEIRRTVSFLFALHPLAVEPVIWISARSSGMFVAFYILGLIAYLKYEEYKKRRYLYFTFLWFLLSLLSKVQAVTFPLALICLDVLILNKNLKNSLNPVKAGLFILSLAFGILALKNPDTADNITLASISYGITDYIFIFFYEVFWYIQKILVPVGLTPIYVYPVKTDGWLPLMYYASAAFPILLFFLIKKFGKQRFHLLFGLLFFYLTLSVTFQIIPSRNFVVADRYGYLSNIGIFLILALVYDEWKLGNIKALSLIKDKAWLGYAIGAALVLLSFIQKNIWENDESLASRIIEQNPETQYIARAYGIRGNYKLNVLRNGSAAISDFEKAAFLDTSDMISRYQLAGIYQSSGDTFTAIKYYRAAQNADPGSPMPLTDLGVLMTQTNQYERGLTMADSALLLVPDFPNAMVVKAVCQLNIGNAKAAEATLSDCILKNPEYAEAYRNRGIIRINNLNQKDKACIDFRKAAELGDENAVLIIRDYCN